MNRIFFSIFLLAVLCCACWAQSPGPDSSAPPDSPGPTINAEVDTSSPQENSPHPSSPTAVWQSDSNLQKELAEDVVVWGFHVRPPQAYVLTQQPGPEGAQLFTWKGPRRQDLTFPFFMLTVVIPPPEEEKVYTQEEALAILLTGIEQRRSDWTETQVEQGQINGLNFARAYWTGTDSITGVKLQGFMYVMVEGKNIIQLSSQDLTDNEAALKLAEAAVLSFHK